MSLTLLAGTVKHTRLMGAPMGVVTEARAVHDIITAAENRQGHWTITATSTTSAATTANRRHGY